MGNTAGELRFVVERKRRPRKPFRRCERYSGNLVAYRRPEFVQSDRTRSTRELPVSMPGVSTGQVLPLARTVEPKAVGRDRARGGLAAVAGPTRRMAPALVIVSTVCTAAMVGSLWWTGSAEDHPTIGDAPLPNAPPPAIAVLDSAGASVERNPDGILDRHLEELGELRSRNRDLEREVESLTRETLELNQELLSLELEIVSLTSSPAPSTEVRTVYNFVNVPIGAPIDAHTASTAASPVGMAADDYPADGRYAPEPSNEVDIGDAHTVEKIGSERGGEVAAYEPDIDVHDDAMDPEEAGFELPAPGARSMMR